MVLEERPADAPKIPLPGMEGSYVFVLAGIVLLLGVIPSLITGLDSIAEQAGDAVMAAVGG